MPCVAVRGGREYLDGECVARFVEVKRMLLGIQRQRDRLEAFLNKGGLGGPHVIEECMAILSGKPASAYLREIKQIYREEGIDWP